MSRVYGFLCATPCWAAIFVALSSSAGAQAPQQPAVRQIRAVRVTAPVVLDGRLVEAAWQQAEAASDFHQRDPDEGRPSTERTELRVLYDANALYLGARLFDSEPAKIVRRLSRRDDEPDADAITVYLDPRHDHLTGVLFTVTAGGSRADAVIHDDTSTDSSWDAVWDSAVAVDSTGWSVEIRIPFSQMRFNASDQQTWGLNVERFIRRKNERDWWVLVPKKENGLASRMGHLEGLDGVEGRRHLEMLPYVSTRGEFNATAAPGNPFDSGHRGFAGAGLDLKWGLTSSLTVDLAANPDFGQVEVDPAVVNLTAFETFFEEKRPFFLEGSQLLTRFGHGGANSQFGFNRSDPTLFYSRRVGRSPQGRASADFVDQPSATTILGAAKLTGKTAGGWSVGLLEAITGREWAHTDTAGVRSQVEVEPATSYTVARVQRDVGQRGAFGVLFTGVTRDLRAPALASLLSSSTYVAGGDGHLFLDKKRIWVITGGLAGSWVNGSPDAILRLQEAPQRYYQRPDAPQVALRPDARSLAGWTGHVDFNKNSGNTTVNAALWGVSPGFESNDAGFMSYADRAGAHAAIVFSKPTPDRWTRSRSLILAKFWVWNFNREVQTSGVFGLAQATLKSYWQVSGNATYAGRSQDDRLTRGGPSMQRPAGGSVFAEVQSDSRKTLSFDVSGEYGWNEYGGWGTSSAAQVQFKPSPRFTVAVGPSWSRVGALAQYVTTVPDPAATATYGQRYVFSNLGQTEVSMTTRLNAIFSPTLSLQVYAQPLISVGRYPAFKELALPHSFSFRYYGQDGGAINYDPAGALYTADPAGGARFSFSNPDFNFKSLRVNAILRWEWRLGSTFYAVWTEQREDFSQPGHFALGPDAGAMASAPADNVVMLKLAYWFGR